MTETILQNKNRIIILLLTTVHSRFDTRIFVKEAQTLAMYYKSNQVMLMVADGMGSIENLSGSGTISIYDIGLISKKRWKRILFSPIRVLFAINKIKPAIVHFHDPELILLGVFLKVIGYRVIYDIHEDVPEDILTKKWIPAYLRKVISWVLKLIEDIAVRKFDSIITATPYIKNRFKRINRHTVNINNYPRVEEFENSVIWHNKKNEVCYVGLISELRGIREVVRAMELTRNVKLNLAGKFTEKDIEIEVKSYHGWKNVDELGFISREQVKNIFKNSMAGIVTFLPAPNHGDSQPNKIFEYMSTGIPVIASNFPLWREIVEDANCGICVDPLNPKEIADAITWIVNNPEQAEQMGKNGRKAIKGKYNWKLEEEKLLEIYKELLR